MSSKSMRQLHQEAMALEKTISGLEDEAGQARIHVDDAASEETADMGSPSSAGQADRA